MSETRTGEELKQIRINILGNDFGLLYDSLYNEIISIEHKWIEFKELFGEKESRFEIMNKTAPYFFYIIQNVLWENLVLGIARITDPISTSGKKNATIIAIPYYLTDLNFKTKIENIIKEIEDRADFCRDWRNRIISHKDLILSIDPQNAKPLKTATRLKFKEVLAQIRELINAIELKYFNQRVGFEYLESENGALNLLHYLESGMKYKKEQIEKRKSGQPTDDNKDTLI